MISPLLASSASCAVHLALNDALISMYKSIKSIFPRSHNLVVFYVRSSRPSAGKFPASPHARDGVQPPHEPVTIHPAQYGSSPQRLLLHRSDIETLTLFDDDTSSVRDDYTRLVTADPTTFRARHMTGKGNAAPVFRVAFKRTCLSSPSEYCWH